MTNKDKAKLEQLDPVAKKHIIDFLEEAKNAGYGKLRVTSVYRSSDEQNRIFGEGRTADQLKRLGINPKYAKPNLSKKTTVYGGRSLHNHRLAADISIINYDKSHWNTIGHLARKNGLVFGGDWRIRDYSHVEYKGNLNYFQIYRGMKPEE